MRRFKFVIAAVVLVGLCSVGLSQSPTTKAEALSQLAEIERQIAELRVILEGLEEPMPDPDPDDDPDPDPDPDDDPDDPMPEPDPSGYMWISPAEIAALPEDVFFDNVLASASRNGNPTVATNDTKVNVWVLAKAYAWAKTKDNTYRKEVIANCLEVIGTDEGGDHALALGRKCVAYVIAAEIIGPEGWEEERFRDWIDGVRYVDHFRKSRRTLIGTHERKPNNWSTAAGASRIAIALYLDDEEELQAAADVFHGWLGNLDKHRFDDDDYGDLDWQPDRNNPITVCRKGARIAQYNASGELIAMRDMDGALPEELRRSGRFRWPPPKENYAYTALQGALVQAMLLDRAGYTDVWEWEDQAIKRAFVWLYDTANFPADGNDVWMYPVLEKEYGLGYWDGEPTEVGKFVGFTGWTHSN